MPRGAASEALIVGTLSVNTTESFEKREGSVLILELEPERTLFSK